ncbi:two-component regulator propeller domain-containing protein [Paraflavisolibacter sp. H34]|uniref:hybrid sensor histidine kinase/response regulator transcription factor n=1 Tax=Huijunlia imazamoxiresistens TaxID=3127457 RepID=UPI00301ABCD5
MKILALMLLLLVACPEGRAQSLSFDYLTVKDGLPQSTVRSITKDKYGFMWMGTWNGLCRYDGYRFKVYRSIPGDTTSLANNRIHYIYKDPSGTLWVATFNSYICRYNYETDNFTRFRPAQLPPALRDSTDRLRNLLPFQQLAEDLRRQIGPFQLSPSREHIVFAPPAVRPGGLNDPNVNCVYASADGILWLGTVSGGVNKADRNAQPFHVYAPQPNGQSNTPVRALAADAGGTWLGTQDEGLAYVSAPTQKATKLPSGPAGGQVRSLYRDSQGDLWIGYRNGLDRYEGGTQKITRYFPKDGDTAYSRFFAIAEDPADRSVWFGTLNGLLRYDRTTGTFTPQPLHPYFTRSGAGCLFFDSKKNLWIGTEYSGLVQLKRDPQTHAWTDTLHFRGDGAHPVLPDERVYSVTEDERGNIWAGTADGLCRIDPRSGALRVFSKKDGLADQYIAKLLADRQGHIWISHKKGLSKLDIQTGVCRNYTVKEGRGQFEFLDGSGYRDGATGRLYFGSMNGFVSFDPGEVRDNPYLPRVVLTELQVLNEPVAAGQKVNGRVLLQGPLHLAKQLTLSHEDRSFSIEFAALHFSSPEKNQYAYKLEGQDKNWITTDASRRIATYANLPAGRYRFLVKASNSDGVWNPEPATLDITVLPPWWRSGWAYAAYTLLALLALYAAWRLLQAREHYHRQLLAERLKAEKAQEVQQLKTSFFTHVSHEFRTPLTLILDPLEALRSGSLSAGRVQEYYGVMHRNARRLLHLINQFLDLRKLESGSRPLQVSRQDLVAFVRQTLAAFSYQAGQRHIDLAFEPDFPEWSFGFDPDVVDKILYNLLSNAFKFTPEGGRIHVTLGASAEDGEGAVLSVTDNGPGVPPGAIDKIFEPFYQAEKKDRSPEGTGVGLSLVRELAALHQGAVTVHNETGRGACFRVTFRNLAPTGAPVSPPEAVPEAATSPLPPPEAGAEPTVVLVVEDNDDVRSYLKMNLAPPYQVVEAVHGAEGWEKALEIVPDLVISDVMMPQMNGLELCKKLKTDEKTSHIPVILLTARPSDVYEGYVSGADDYIVKPFSSALLLVRVKNLIESRVRLRQLWDKSTGFNPRLVGTNEGDKAFLGKATALIEAHMSREDFSVEWLASQLFLSRTQLYRKIKALTNQTVHDFVTTIRLNKAAELLLAGQHSVSEVAYLVGYSDGTSFGRVFQKQFGQTPKKYSQNLSPGLAGGEPDPSPHREG